MTGEEVIVFITRKFPPQAGGMERAAYELFKHLSRVADVKLMKWGGSNKWLLLVLPYLFLKSIWFLISNKVSVIYLQDGLLAPLGLMLKILTGKRVVITIHGLDITYKNRLYQFVIPKCVKRLDKVICVSNATKETCEEKGIQGEKITVIPDGVSDDFRVSEAKQKPREEFSHELKINLHGKKMLLSVGRLVERKGFHWFVENVLPLLMENANGWLYLMVGGGNFAPHIQDAVTRNGFQDHAFMLGRVSEEILKVLYSIGDIFIMPNIPVTDDLEGFGIVALEASSCGLPVVASNLEGISEAIKDNENGFLIEPGSAYGFASKIRELLENDDLRARFGGRARRYTLENYGWERIAGLYLEQFIRV